MFAIQFNLYKFQRWVIVGLGLWATTAMTMEINSNEMRKAAQEKLFRLVSLRCHDSLSDFLVANGELVDLNTPNEDGHYPLNIAMQLYIEGSRTYESVAVLRRHGAQFDPRVESTEVMWANILHNAVTMRKVSRLRSLLEEFRPSEETIDYMLTLMPKYEASHGREICRDVTKELRKATGDDASEQSEEAKFDQICEPKKTCVLTVNVLKPAPKKHLCCCIN